MARRQQLRDELAAKRAKVNAASGKARRGRPLTAEWRAKISAGQQRRMATPEGRAHIQRLTAQRIERAKRRKEHA